MSLARVLARLRSRQGHADVLSVLVGLLALVPLVYVSATDPVWIAGIYDASDFDEVVLMLIGADTGPSGQPTGIASLLPVNLLTRVGVFSPVAIRLGPSALLAPTHLTARSGRSRAPRREAFRDFRPRRTGRLRYLII
jgi:hypothetical protein